jgi:hypothetical protein
MIIENMKKIIIQTKHNWSIIKDLKNILNDYFPTHFVLICGLAFPS